jgi:hypothetical protein
MKKMKNDSTIDYSMPFRDDAGISGGESLCAFAALSVPSGSRDVPQDGHSLAYADPDGPARPAGGRRQERF